MGPATPVRRGLPRPVAPRTAIRTCAAALLAARLKCAVLTALRMGMDIDAAAHAARSVLAEEEERFVTLVVARIDPPARTLQRVNAGHNRTTP